VWRDEAAFRKWVDSEAFKKAHAQGKLTGVLAGPPRFVGWTSVPLD
jgi:heme-degrading monooxygenase HmoA